MRYAIISDVHANLEALQAVRRKLALEGFDKMICLGDFVGYNPDPAPCIIILKDEISYAVRGNHDKAVADLIDLNYFNYHAREAVLWTRQRLLTSELDFLRNLAHGPILVNEKILICHGSPEDEDRYLITNRDIESTFVYLRSKYPKVKICFFGHTHLPYAASQEDGFIAKNGSLQLKKNQLYLINPGSVDQPRDGNFKAAFGIYDDIKDEFYFYRVDYPLEETGQKIIHEGLPALEAERLKLGR